MSFSVYKNKRVLITGHTGFKGAWLSLWLQHLQADVIGYALEPPHLSLHNILKGEGIYGDICDFPNLQKVILNYKPDIIFHLAAQALVRPSYQYPIQTYRTNLLGSLYLLEAARTCPSVQAIVNITTDKCYENKEQHYSYNEDDPLGGYDMYSSSKACVEIMSSSYRRSFLSNHNSYALATARAGNVIGGGDWSCDRLIPDCIRAIQEKKPIILRNPSAIRPWQHVLEPLSGYLHLGAMLLSQNQEYQTAFNFGPHSESNLTVLDIVNKVVSLYGEGTILIQEDNALHEATLLTLNIEKASRILGWHPTYSIDIALEKTISWYKAFYEHHDMHMFTLSQILSFQQETPWMII